LSYIFAIETAVPDYSYSQQELTDFYLRSTDDKAHRRKIKIVAERSGISKRYSVIKDFKSSPDNFEFFNKTSTLLPEPSLSQRMQVYKQQALPLALKAIKKIKDFNNIKKSVTHIITVTCTGLYAPGLDIDLMKALELRADVHRSSVNFMGCNAAVLALKQAHAICNSTLHANVLVVCVELCTLHFQKRYNDDYILSNLIFGDGAAAVLVSSDPLSHSKDLVQIKSFKSLILHNGYKDMAWQLSETGFIMNLTSYVSGLIKENIKPMLASVNLKTSEIDHWAIHPGGKRILDDFCSALDLDKSKLSHTYQVLKDYGNMSSPTVLFVLKNVLDQTNDKTGGQTIFMAAFGPGISIETMQMAYV